MMFGELKVPPPDDLNSLKGLTDALNPEINEDFLVTATVERFIASDGVTVPGIMYKPQQASADNPVPAIVFVHGGPGGQSTRGYSALVQHLVNHGYAVYAANNRGSSGYGKTFFHMDDKRHGEEDLRDIVEAGDYLRSLDWVDADKVGVMGGSYGGFMTAAALTFHPEAFEVGVNIFGVTNWLRTLRSIPPWWESFKDALYEEMGDMDGAVRERRAVLALGPTDRADAHYRLAAAMAAAAKKLTNLDTFIIFLLTLETADRL